MFTLSNLNYYGIGLGEFSKIKMDKLKSVFHVSVLLLYLWQCYDEIRFLGEQIARSRSLKHRLTFAL